MQALGILFVFGLAFFVTIELQQVAVIMGFLFSGLGVFAASLFVDMRRENVRRRNLLTEADREIRDNLLRYSTRPSPLAGFFPLRNVMLEQSVQHRARYFANHQHLNAALDTLNRYVLQGAQAWELFRDVYFGRVAGETARKFTKEHHDTYMEMQYALFPLVAQWGCAEIAVLLHKTPDVILTEKWAKATKTFLSTREFSPDDNPFISGVMSSMMAQLMRLTEAAADAVLAGHFGGTDMLVIMRSDMRGISGEGDASEAPIENITE